MLLLLLIACGEKKEQDRGEDESLPEWTFKVEPRQNGDEIVIEMFLTNEQEQKSSLEFSSSQLYEIVLTNKKKEEVYRYSKERMFLAVITQLVFAPKEVKTFEEVIPLDNMEAGEYTLDVKFVTRTVDEQASFDRTQFQQREIIQLK